MATSIAGNSRPSSIAVSFQRIATFIAWVYFLAPSFRFNSTNAFSVPKPSNTQAKWLDYEIGAIVHFNMQTFSRFMKPGNWLNSFYELVICSLDPTSQAISLEKATEILLFLTRLSIQSLIFQEFLWKCTLRERVGKIVT